MNWDPNQWPADRRVRRGFVHIGRLVKRRRLNLVYSQRDLERLSGVDQTAISRLENGKLYGLRWARFARIVDALEGLDDTSPSAERPPWPGAADGGALDSRALASVRDDALVGLPDGALVGLPDDADD